MYKMITLYILLLVLVAGASIVLANQNDILKADILPAPTRTPEHTIWITSIPTPYQKMIPNPTGIPRQPEPLIVRVESVNVHALPELSAQVIGWLNQNDQVLPEFCASGWVKLIGSGYVWGACFEHNPCGDQGSCR